MCSSPRSSPLRPDHDHDHDVAVAGSGSGGSVSALRRAEKGPPARRRLGPDARREQILDGAMRLFGERPYAAVSTVELARELGVARGLINHYFGTKRALYLEVVRRVATIPPRVVGDLPPGPADQRARAAVDWFLGAIEHHRGLWLTVGLGGVGVPAGDPDVDTVLAEADEIAAERVVDALVVPGRDHGREAVLVRARIRSFFGLVRAASHEWLVRGSMDREQVASLLVTVLLAVVEPDPPSPRAEQDTQTSHS